MGILEHLHTIAWQAIPQPSWNHPDTIPQALQLLAAPSDEADSWNAYHAFLFAIGNNHAGTYFPVILTTIPFLTTILDCGSLLARLRTMDILIDILAAFHPEIGYEYIHIYPMEEQSLQQCLFHAIVDLWTPRSEYLLHSTDPAECALATELDQTIRDANDTSDVA